MAVMKEDFEGVPTDDIAIRTIALCRLTLTLGSIAKMVPGFNAQAVLKIWRELDPLQRKALIWMQCMYIY